MKRRSSLRAPATHSLRIPENAPCPGRGAPACLLVLILALLAIAPPSQADPPPNSLVINEIAVEGNQRASEAAIVNTFGLETGEEHLYSEVREALERLYGMGMFDDIRLYIDRVPGGERITLEVVERPVVASLKIRGNDKVSEKDIREKIEISVGSSLNPRLVQKSILGIKEACREKGYYFAEASHVIEQRTETSVTLIFEVNEGVKVKVGSINFEGNREVSDGDLRDAMETKTRKWLMSQDYKPDDFEADLQRIETALKDRGFRDARIVDYDVTFDEKEGKADITITVDEGRRYYVDKVSVVMTAAGDSADVLSGMTFEDALELKAGEPYSLGDYQGTLERVYSAVGDYGFVYAEVIPEEIVHGDSVDVVFRVRPNEAVHVRRIIIEGNTVTFEKVIRRELTIRPGDILRRTVVERSHRDVFNLGYFNDVQVGTNVANEKGDIDLIFKVEERPTGIGNVGIGYTGEFGFTGFIEFSHNNVGWFSKFPWLGLGKGENLNLRWEFGKLSQIELSWRNPWFMDSRTLVGFDIYATRREYETYADRRDGFSVLLGTRFPLIDYSQIFWRYRLERRELDPDPAKASEAVLAQAGSNRTSSIVITFSRNSVDNPFFPRNGSKTTVTAELAGGKLLGGDSDYQSYILDNSHFMPMFHGTALVLRGRAGVLDGLGSHGYIPIYERYRLGGTSIDGIRGYTEREIVPEGNALDEGGRFFVLGSLEYRVPVVPNKAFLLAFADAGETWNSLSASRPGYLRKSVGAGFRIFIPMMGTIGFDFAYGFDRDRIYGGPSWETHFQFGMSRY
ncbi:MAG: outer membrane protein assembly factor BamA [bacterium]